MGWFDSDYEATGSVSTTQIGTQREARDTYYGELLLKNQFTKDTYYDNMYDDIMKGLTATFRGYKRIGERNGFDSFISNVNGNNTNKLSVIKETNPSVTSETGKWGTYDGISVAKAEMSNNQVLLYNIRTNTGTGIGTVVINGTRTVVLEIVDSSGKLAFELETGVTHVTTYPISSGSSVGYYTTVMEPSRTYYFFSTDSRLDAKFDASLHLDAYPCVSLQDDGNNEEPYYKLGSGNPDFDKREETLDELTIDFEELSKSMFEPDEIPDMGTEDWDNDYKPLYEDSQEIKDEFGSEQEYHDEMVTGRQEAIDSQKDITDVHIGTFLSPKPFVNKKLTKYNKEASASAYAMFAFFMDTLPYLPIDGRIIPLGETKYDGLLFDVQSGSLKMKHHISWYKHGRAIGKVEDYAPDGILLDSNFMDIADTVMKVKNKGRISFGVVPIYLNVNSNDMDDLALGGGIFSDAHRILSPCGMIAIAKPSALTSTGERTYEYLEVRGPMAQHIINTLHDGEHGTKQNVVIFGNLFNVDGIILDENGEETSYSDVILYPLTRYALKRTPIFKRERLLRECLIVITSGISVTEVKWYEKGWVKIVISIVVAVAGCILTSCVGTAAFFSAAGLTAVVQYVAISLVAGFAIGKILENIDNPILAALIVVVSAVMLGKSLNGMSTLQLATLAIEATGTYIQKEFMIEMEEMQKKARELKKKYSDMEEKIDKLMEESGFDIDGIDMDLAKFMASLPPAGELAEDFFKRTIKRDFAIITQDGNIGDDIDSVLPHRRK